MNERLEALCEQAISEVWESRKGPDDLVRTDGNPYIFYGKFAELIVRECARVARLTESDYGDDYKSGRTWAGIDILEHFGVEE